MIHPGRHKLSSRQTFMWKYVAPALITVSLLVGSYVGWKLDFAPVTMISMYTAFGIFLGIYIYFFRSLKRVWIDDTHLYVSNFREDEKIPLSEVARISELKIFNPRHITIHLTRPANFGSKIVFLGYHQQWLLFGIHPAVTLIEEKLDKLKP